MLLALFWAKGFFFFWVCLTQTERKSEQGTVQIIRSAHHAAAALFLLTIMLFEETSRSCMQT